MIVRTTPCLLTTAFLLSVAACSHQAAVATPPAPVAVVELQAAVTRPMQDNYTAYGTVDFSPTLSSTVPVAVESQVALLLTRAGAQVKRGDPLMQLVPSPATRLELDKAQGDAALADSDVGRLRRLRSEGLATESELQTAINAAATTTHLRDSLAARVGPGHQQILRAPRDGIVDSLAVQPGDVLAAGSVAARISSGETLLVRLGIEAADISRIAIGQTVRLTTLALSPVTVVSKIDGVDQRIDALTRQATAIAHIKPVIGLLPGAALRGDIAIATHTTAVAVPRAALVFADTADTAPLLFVAVAGKAQRRAVKTGIRDSAWVEISDGLNAGEVVVTAGNAVLEDGMAIRTEAAVKPAVTTP